MSFDVRKDNIVFKHTIDTESFNSSANYKEHFHTEYEILYFLHGDAEFYIEDEKYEVKPGFLLFIKPGEYHYIKLLSNKPYERIVIRFNKGDVNKDLQDKIDDLARVYSIWNSPLEDALKRLDIYYEHLQDFDIFNLFLNNLNIVLAYLIKAENLKQLSVYVNKDLEVVLNYIHENLVNINTVIDIEKHVYLSRSILYELFSKEMGIPIMSYVRTQKCMLAKNLIENGEHPTSVYFKCGFNDYSSFYRTYIKVFNKKPSSLK